MLPSSIISVENVILKVDFIFNFFLNAGQSGGNNNQQTEAIELVPTVDSVRYSFLTVLLTLYKNPILLTGWLSVINMLRFLT